MRQPAFVATVVALAAGGAFVLAQAPEKVYQGKEENLPLSVAPQPVPFSHKVHAAAGSECKDCHRTAATSDTAGLPQADRCMICHRAVAKDKPVIERLAKLAADGEKIAWERVYKVPDFVFFSHKNHLAGGEECGTCHGPVAERDVLAKEVSTSMTACMNCHAAREVSNDCHFCHALGF